MYLLFENIVNLILWYGGIFVSDLVNSFVVAKKSGTIIRSYFYILAVKLFNFPTDLFLLCPSSRLFLAIFRYFEGVEGQLGRNGFRLFDFTTRLASP